MSFDYDEIAVLSSEMLAEFGQAVTLRNYTVGTYDTATGQTTTTYTDTTCNGAIFDFKAGQTFGPGGLIEGGDRQLLLAPTVAPNLEDHVIVGGVEWVIHGVAEIGPAGTPVLYTLHLRS